MATVYLDAEEAREGDLPHVCIECGRRAVGLVERRFYYAPWLFRYHPTLKVLSIFVTRYMVCWLPMCKDHERGGYSWRGPAHWWGGIRPTRITKDGITFAGVDEYFVEALEDYRDGLRKKAIAARGPDALPQRRPRSENSGLPRTREPSTHWAWIVTMLLCFVVTPTVLCGGFLLFTARRERPVAPIAPPWRPNDGPAPAAKVDAKPEMVWLLAVAPDAGFPGAFPLPAFVAFTHPDLPRQLPDAEIDKLIADLKSQGPFRARDAAKKLATVAPSEERRKDLQRPLEALLRGRDASTHEAAANALAVWGTPDSVPALIDVLNTDRFPNVHYAAMNALAAIKDPRAADAVARQLADHWHRAKARQALERMGPFAEKAVLPYLTDKDRNTRIEACNALAVIGTAQSLEALQTAAKDGDMGVAQAAQNAIAAIKARK